MIDPVDAFKTLIRRSTLIDVVVLRFDASTTSLIAFLNIVPVFSVLVVRPTSVFLPRGTSQADQAKGTNIRELSIGSIGRGNSTTLIGRKHPAFA